MKRILCLYTGGTIGSKPTSQGLAPAAGALQDLLTELAAHLPDQPDVTLLEYPQLLDSSSMGPADWNHIAADISARHDEFDGFVVLHGTDTLAFTAAALSFQLENLAKPVLLTGSQRPWLQTGSDASANVALALKNAAGGWPGVRVAFGGRLLPGTRVRKSDADHDQAFSAPNWNGIWPESPDYASPAHCINVDPATRIAALKLYPGYSCDWLAAALAQPLQGLVLETFGSGNLPDSPALIAALNQQAQSGAIIVNCSQCHAGKVQQGQYAASAALSAVGVIPAGDMTAEAALTKLYYLFAIPSNSVAIRTRFTQNLRGELNGKLC